MKLRPLRRGRSLEFQTDKTGTVATRPRSRRPTVLGAPVTGAPASPVILGR